MACGVVKIRQVGIFGLSGLVALMVLLLGLPVSRAAEGYVIYDAHDLGGLHVTVLATPNPISVGKIHFFVRLAQSNGLNGEQPYRGAQLLVEFYPVSGPGAAKSSAYIQRQDLVAPESEPGTYELSDSIQNEGNYQATLTVQNAQKPITASFNFKALPEPDDRFFSVLLLSLFPIFLAWLIWMYLKRPGSKSGQTTPAREAGPGESLAAGQPDI